MEVLLESQQFSSATSQDGSWVPASSTTLTSQDEPSSCRHTVIVEVVEGKDFQVVRKQGRKYFVKLRLEDTKWRTGTSLKSNNPSWHEYFIGEFTGTKLESPLITVQVKYQKTRSHALGVCKIPLLSVSGTDPVDRWYDLVPSKSTACQPKLRLRITCRKSYDRKSEVEVEVQVINGIANYERDIIARKKEKISKLTATKESKAKSKQEVQNILRHITFHNKHLHALSAHKQQLLESAQKRNIQLTASEMELSLPSGEYKPNARAELQARLLAVRRKLLKEQEAFEFHKRYSSEIDDSHREDWVRNTEEHKRRLTYLQNREKTSLALLQEAIRKEKDEWGLDSDELDAALEIQGDKDSGATEKQTRGESSDYPFPGVPLHREDGFSTLKGAPHEDDHI